MACRSVASGLSRQLEHYTALKSDEADYVNPIRIPGGFIAELLKSAWILKLGISQWGVRKQPFLSTKINKLFHITKLYIEVILMKTVARS